MPGTVTVTELRVAGERVLLDPLGAALVPSLGLMAVADLHLEKGSAAARRGSLLPPWDTRATLDRLAALLHRHGPACVVAVGDSFHDPGGSARLAPADQARLRAMTDSARFVWVMGNHDPCPPQGIAGECHAEWRTGPFVFRHQAAAWTDRMEVSGHYHPKARIPARGAVVTRPCFVAGADRLMLPALGAYAGGLDVRDPAIARLFPRGARVFLLGTQRLFAFTLDGVPETAGHPIL